MRLFLPRPTSRPESWHGVALLFRARWRRGVGVVVPQLGRVVQVDAAIGAPPARTTFAHFRPRTALPAGLLRPGNQLVCAFAGIPFGRSHRYSVECACCSGVGWDAGWRMRRTHSVAPCPCMLLPSLAVLSLAAALLHQPSVEGIFIPGLQPGAHRGVLGDISPMIWEIRCAAVAVRVSRQSFVEVASECACRRLFVAGPRASCARCMEVISGAMAI